MVKSMMKKPKWLKKENKDKPWKYNKTIFPSGKPLEIEVYNFGIGLFGEPTVEQVKEAMEWINEQTSKS